jgi:hypothetical protein
MPHRLNYRNILIAVSLITLIYILPKISSYSTSIIEFNNTENSLRTHLINKNNNIILEIYKLYDYINLNRSNKNKINVENLDNYYISPELIEHSRFGIINIDELENINYKLNRKKQLLKKIAINNYTNFHSINITNNKISKTEEEL